MGPALPSVSVPIAHRIERGNLIYDAVKLKILPGISRCGAVGMGDSISCLFGDMLLGMVGAGRWADGQVARQPGDTHRCPKLVGPALRFCMRTHVARELGLMATGSRGISRKELL